MIPRAFTAGKLLPGEDVGVDFTANPQSHAMEGLGEPAQSQWADYHEINVAF
ncbi:MAG TPA: hypothetical protein VN829_17300 [Dongiaceae bacterium]|nr:hypothetical protein [Dongiaceae bacterium]